MKRLLCLFLTVCLVLSGCVWATSGLREPVRFYYLRQQYQYGTQENVLVSVEREASGHAHDLNYLMALYLMGPSEEGLVSPLPRGTRIYSAAAENGTISLTLSDTAKTLTDLEFSLACACLSLTGMEITGAGTAIIQSGERSVTMTREDLMLFDDVAAEPTEDTP